MTCNCGNCQEITLEAGYEAGQMVVNGGGEVVNIEVDDALDAYSTNPVQNKVITLALLSKASQVELEAKADKTELAKLVTKEELAAQNFLTNDSLDGYAKTSEVDNQIEALRKQIESKGDIVVEDDGAGNITLGKNQMDIDVTDDGEGNVSIIL